MSYSKSACLAAAFLALGVSLFLPSIHFSFSPLLIRLLSSSNSFSLLACPSYPSTAYLLGIQPLLDQLGALGKQDETATNLYIIIQMQHTNVKQLYIVKVIFCNINKCSTTLND